MGYLVTDDQGLPKPQYETENGSSFEAHKGKEGAAFSFTKDGHNETLGKTSDLETSNTLVGLFKSLRVIVTSIKDTLVAIKVKADDMPGKSDTSRVTLATLNNTAIVGAVDITTSPVELRIGGAALTSRRTVQVYNTSADVIVYIGFKVGVTISTGFPLYPMKDCTLSLSTGSNLLVYAVAAAPTQVRVVES